MTRSRVVKWGNSLAVRIPKAVAAKARIQEGDAVLIDARKGIVEVRSAEKLPTFEELVAQITPENRYQETDWGPAAGKEIVGW
jgi:antitoxin MazE